MRVVLSAVLGVVFASSCPANCFAAEDPDVARVLAQINSGGNRNNVDKMTVRVSKHKKIQLTFLPNPKVSQDQRSQ